MSNDEEEFLNVKALVRGLHGPTKNVSRPPLSPQSGISSLTQQHQKQQQYHHNNLPQALSSPTDKYTCHNDHHLNNHQNEQFHHSNHSLNMAVPSLVVTGTDHHDNNPDNPNQRRFSQFYLGLRRFSNSHTVFCTQRAQLLALYYMNSASSKLSRTLRCINIECLYLYIVFYILYALCSSQATIAICCVICLTLCAQICYFIICIND